MLTVKIPGKPRPHGRPRARKQGNHVRMYTDPKDMDWRGVAQVHMLAALGVQRPAFVLSEPVALTIEAVFPCPASDHRKRTPAPRRWHAKSRNNDTDNIAKAVMDAGNGILWQDDAQVASLTVRKYVAAQGEAAYTRVTVEPLTEDPE